jgi:effector-binding domain-containing protein
MEIKNIHPVTVLSFKKQIKLPDLQEFVRIKARELYYDAIHNNLEVMGPVYWVYYGMDGNPQALFTLEIALPVLVSNGYSGDFAISQLAPFKCISAIHTDGWDKLPGTYRKLYGEAGRAGYTPVNECREIYINIDFNNAENNITEVQVGIH